MTNELAVKGEAALEHYGIKGMRWGVRKKRSRSAESAEAARIKKKKVFEMSNEELKKVNARLDLEKKYSTLNPSTGAKAKKLIGGMAGSVAKQVVSNAVSQAASNYAKKILGGS